MQKLSSDNQPIDTDQALMLQYVDGDMSAFETLYQQHKGPLFRYFVRQLDDPQLAEDLYQEVWSKVIRAADNYQPSAKFTTWLYKIAHNLIIDHVRAVKPVDLFSDANQDDEPFESQLASDVHQPDDDLAQQQKASILKRCMSLLPPVQKEALLLNIEMGFTAVAIGEIAGVSIEATKSRIRYANQGLKSCVNQHWQQV